MGPTPTLAQVGFAWHDDDGSEAASSQYTEDTDQTFDVASGNVKKRVRIVLDCTTSDFTDGFHLHVQRNGTGGFSRVTTTSSYVKSAASGGGSPPSDADDTTDRITGSGIGTFITPNAGWDSNGVVGSFTITKNDHVQLEWCLEFISADLADADTLDFKVYTDADVALNGGYGTADTNAPRADITKVAAGVDVDFSAPPQVTITPYAFDVVEGIDVDFGTPPAVTVTPYAFDVVEGIEVDFGAPPAVTITPFNLDVAEGIDVDFGTPPEVTITPYNLTISQVLAWETKQVGTGNWSRSSENADSPWYDGTTQSGWASVPGNGDTATIAHAVAVGTNTTVGTSAAEGTVDGLTVSGGNLTINEDVTLIVRDGIAVSANRSIIMSLGSAFKFDAGQATDPTNQNYPLQLGPGGHGQVASLVCNGTEAKPCTVTSVAGGGNGYIDPTPWQSGQVRATWTNFSKLGTASIAAMRLRPVSGGTVVLSDCTFDNCGLVFMQAAATTIVGTLDRVTFTNSLNATYSFQYAGGDATRLKHCSFDIGIELAGSGLAGTIDDCYFGEKISRTNYASLTSFARNFIRTTDNQSVAISDTLAEDLYLFNDNVSTNGRAFNCKQESNAIVLSGCIIQHPDGEFGDYILDGATTGGNKATIQNCIFLPNSSASSPGGFLNLLNSHPNGETFECLHNTVVSNGTGETGLAGYGETQVGTAAEIPVCKSNVIWSGSGGAAGVKSARRNNGSTPVQDAITPSGWDYNWGWGLATGSEGNGFQDNDVDTPDMFSTVPTDSNGGSGDPQFVDETRNLETWGSSEEGTDGSIAAALAVLAADTTKIAELIAWVKAGFAPQNSDLEDAGHDSVTIGAEEGVFGVDVDFSVPPAVTITPYVLDVVEGIEVDFSAPPQITVTPQNLTIVEGIDVAFGTPSAVTITPYALDIVEGIDVDFSAPPAVTVTPYGLTVVEGIEVNFSAPPNVTVTPYNLTVTVGGGAGVPYWVLQHRSQIIGAA